MICEMNPNHRDCSLSDVNLGHENWSWCGTSEGQFGKATVQCAASECGNWFLLWLMLNCCLFDGFETCLRATDLSIILLRS